MKHSNDNSEGERKGMISIVPLNGEGETDEASRALLELQLKMATSSINHEYARMEYDETACGERKDELLEYMNDCRSQYFQAREELVQYDPYALAEFERDLFVQKQQTLTQYNA